MAPYQLETFQEKHLVHKIEEINSIQSRAILSEILQPFQAHEFYTLVKLQVIFNDINLCCIKKSIHSKDPKGQVSINGEIQITQNQTVKLFYKFFSETEIREHYIIFSEDGDSRFQ